MTNPIQCDNEGRLRHLLTLEGLPRGALEALLDRAQALTEAARGGTSLRGRLAGRTACTLFFEPSTRTRGSFQLAAQRLGMDVVNVDVSTSSAKKGETDLDTLRTLEAMGVDAFIVRHGHSGAVDDLAAGAAAGTVLVNGGDGTRAHPTQGLLDMLTLRQAKGQDFSGLKVVVVGDVRHSRVARSDIHALKALGIGELRVCGPAGLLPDRADPLLAGVVSTASLDEAVEGVDAVFMLRLQRERMEEGLVPSLDGYFAAYGLDERRLARARPDAVVLHPGPMNRGVEISPEVADGPRSLILRQVANGVAVRMAVLEQLLAG
ncbi:aspartate carbamoyltransferase catalytic subunit [Alkalisalibacterium limincola]|uniref:aspartate carbamoyltransferase catalytic subunit n=1 Tax=Alkalisalibacterium limincola TaxID=2699169 RepID=UPI00164F3846|nr:aspartate carbamoyltransferase catalytic subunit [Alkalisalibacterium limincola]